jgi:uncharacterized protein
MVFDAIPAIASELALAPDRVAAVLRLEAEGGTVPFIARYRKEATGGLDETRIRAILERRAYLEDLGKRREAIRESIAAQGKLTPELLAALDACRTKTELEDFYLPFRPKRKTRASMARERGLGPLAERILAQPRIGDPEREAAPFVDPARDVPDGAAALAGARDIVAEAMAERADLRALARETFSRQGTLVSKVVKKKVAGGTPTRFEDYYDYSEPVTRIPSHRFLAVRRGEKEGVLSVGVEAPEDGLIASLLRGMGHRPGTPFSEHLREAVRDGFARLLAPAVEKDVLADLKERSDRAAVEVFASNLRDLLLAAPLGGKPVLGVDPGFRTGGKCAALDGTGRLLAHGTIHPFEPRRADEAARAVRDLVATHRPAAIAVGNGTAGRETMDFLREALGPAGPEAPLLVSVNEAGASVYSASDAAREEFPDLDLTVRGAISIARRLMDPLAELVKIEPKALGVGQYQHDVDQGLLAAKLDEVVESCVNLVGVEVNTASAALLARVAGLRPSVALSIVAHRSARGPFRGRRELLDVAGLGPRAFEQAAGFLRIRGASNPLDASAVHPERYGLVAEIAKDLGVGLAELVGNADLAGRIDARRYVRADAGEPTLRDIVSELAKPGRDPRESFTAPSFRDDVRKIEDVRPGMTFTGVVTNVAAFGAFVDIGVHQDGLVHVSELADRYVRDPHEVVRAGQRLPVTVLAVDVPRRRISLSAERRGATETQP